MPDTRTIQELIHQVERGELTLPEFQRGYVWNRRQVSSLVTSLYHAHPTGHLLVWKTNNPTNLRGADAGDDQGVAPGGMVTLNGSNSFDPNGNLIAFEWGLLYPT